MKKYIIAFFTVIIIFFCVVSICSYSTELFQILGLNYNTSNLLSYIFILILSILIYFLFEYIEKENKKKIQNLLNLNNLVNQFDYNNLTNIKNIYIFDDFNFKVVLKCDANATLNFPIKTLPRTQQELESLDDNIFIRRRL